MKAFLLSAATLFSALPAQLYTTDAGVQSPALPSLRERIEWQSRRDADEWIATTTAVFSPSRFVQLDFAAPVVSRRVDGAVRGQQGGLGDVQLAAKVALLRADDVMSSDRLSVLLAARAPTGDDDATIDGIDFGPRGGLGLGTWGYGAGVAGTVVRDRHRAAVALRWEDALVDSGFAPGHAVAVDVAWWYRLTPAVFVAGRDQIELRWTTELLWRHATDDRLAGSSLANGGDDLTLVLGLQAHPTPALALECGARIPLLTDIDGPFGGERVGALFSCRISF